MKFHPIHRHRYDSPILEFDRLVDGLEAPELVRHVHLLKNERERRVHAAHSLDWRLQVEEAAGFSGIEKAMVRYWQMPGNGQG